MNIDEDEDLSLQPDGYDNLRTHSRMEVALSRHPSLEQESESDPESNPPGGPPFPDGSDREPTGHLAFDEHKEASVQLEAELDDVIERL